MPTYEYRCENGHIFETIQKMADDPLTECEVCGASVERVFHPVAVHFKGSGFYSTDYGTSKAKAESSSAEGQKSKPDGAKPEGGEKKEKKKEEPAKSGSSD